MFEWLSSNRASIAAVLFVLVFAAFIWSIVVGRRQSRLRSKSEVFGDPARTRGGWYWSVTGVTALLLAWGYYSWGIARAYFPNSANEMCQVAKLEEAVSPIKASLPIGARYDKSTLLAARNAAQLGELLAELPSLPFTDAEKRELDLLVRDIMRLIANSSNPDDMSPQARDELAALSERLIDLGGFLRAGATADMTPTPEALAQPRWGTTFTEIPMLPVTSRGVLFDRASVTAAEIAGDFNRIRNRVRQNAAIMEDIDTRIAAFKKANQTGSFDEPTASAREEFVKAVERIFRRLDDGLIFPAAALAEVNSAIRDLDGASRSAQGSLRIVDVLFMPGPGIVKSQTQCTEQGSARWLPKPTDVVATFARLANPDVEHGGGYRGFPLLWWDWVPVSGIVAFFVPDWIADAWPGEYAAHGPDGTITPTFKDKLLAFAQGEVDLGSIPMLDGHVWDSLFRVLVALGMGIFLGVPLGLFMGVARFFKSFFDPLIELYRPVPPLAWAPLILTIFGIGDNGKIFLLFMVAFAIMVISARTGASGVQLSKIRAAHSLGASDRQIMWTVIFPNALPEILTGIRIAVGVCWGTLVAAEMLAGTTGIGFIENIARTVSDYELIWVTILIMGILGLVFDLGMRWVIRKTIPWRGMG